MAENIEAAKELIEEILPRTPTTTKGDKSNG
jgi:hypothetical protein